MTDIPDFTIEKEVKKSKSQKVGKQFEKDFKDSIPDDVFYYRFKDGTAGFSGTKNENVRFQSKNICDCMLFHRGVLCLLELKTVKGKSFSFNNVRDNQIKELEKSTYFGIIAGFIINFRDLEKTIFIEVNEFIDMMNRSSKKSFNQDDLQFHKYTEISSKKLKVHYRYDIEKFLLF